MGWPKCPYGENRLSWLHGFFSQMRWLEECLSLLKDFSRSCLGASLTQRAPRRRRPAQRKVLSSLWAEMFVREKTHQTSQTICVLSGLQKFHMVAQVLLLYVGVPQKDAVFSNISYMSCYAQCRWPAQGTVAMHPHCQKPTSPYKTRVVELL